jgi:hypothetical protein
MRRVAVGRKLTGVDFGPMESFVPGGTDPAVKHLEGRSIDRPAFVAIKAAFDNPSMLISPPLATRRIVAGDRHRRRQVPLECRGGLGTVTAVTHSGQ